MIAIPKPPKGCRLVGYSPKPGKPFELVGWYEAITPATKKPPQIIPEIIPASARGVAYQATAEGTPSQGNLL